MNRKKRKERYIKIKNSWRSHIKKWGNIVDITIGWNHAYDLNPRYPRNKIVMDFKNREEIVKFGVMKMC
ncbi:MAG TPA: hypothetical protein VK590_05510 [Saprospiraceae bacterium]|nr:hypothetical protein [Saprospiraceae bacterium]